MDAHPAEWHFATARNDYGLIFCSVRCAETYEHFAAEDDEREHKREVREGR